MQRWNVDACNIHTQTYACKNCDTFQPMIIHFDILRVWQISNKATRIITRFFRLRLMSPQQGRKWCSQTISYNQFDWKATSLKIRARQAYYRFLKKQWFLLLRLIINSRNSEHSGAYLKKIEKGLDNEWTAPWGIVAQEFFNRQTYSKSPTDGLNYKRRNYPLMRPKIVLSSVENSVLKIQYFSFAKLSICLRK